MALKSVAVKPLPSVKVYHITLGHLGHGLWAAQSPEEAFRKCRRWYGSRMPRWINLFTIEEVTPWLLWE